MKGILTYHSIDNSGSVLSTDEECFRRHVRWLASGRVRVTTLEELPGETSDRHAVAVTFDDAFVNFDTVAWPLLREHGVPVTLFVPTGHVGDSNRWPGQAEPGIPTLPLLDWDALVRLSEDGVSLGSHSRTHRDLRKLDEGDLRDELEDAAETLRDRTGRRPATFAYPYGLCDDRTAERVREAYELACTTELRVLGTTEDRCRLPRLDAYYFRRPGALESWGSSRFRWSLRLRGAARGIRQRVTDLRTPRR
jgi:peptidoglycan/xylan/chitin deacetylase (PgdA/CDA1 family)